jgi:hypothetical protein
MADLKLPAMLPRGTTELWALGCWARQDDAPPFCCGSSSPYASTCLAKPASDLGLCAHHLLTLFPEARSNASRP